MAILLVEDDVMLARALSESLSDAGYVVDQVGHCRAALQHLQTQVYEAMLLDLGLPDGDGCHLLQQLRERGQPLPVLAISARGAVDTRVAVLDSGADDYLAKPFSVQELLLRLQSVLRRSQTAGERSLVVGKLRLHLQHGLLEQEGQRLRLTPREAEMLALLMEKPGQIITRQEIRQRLYGESASVDSNVIDVLMHGLRRKLSPGTLTTVRGVGWSLPCP